MYTNDHYWTEIITIIMIIRLEYLKRYNSAQIISIR